MINHEEEIVSTSFDPVAGVYTYKMHRDGRHWTVTVLAAAMDAAGPILGAAAHVNRQRRRDVVSAHIERAMRGPADGE